MLSVEGKYGVIRYCVIGIGKTKFFEEYEDALDGFNFRWMKLKFGE